MTNIKTKAGFLEILSPPQLVKKIPFYFGDNVIGRSNLKASIVLEDKSVSQKHATLTATSEGVKLVDNYSKNGTALDNAQITLIKGQQYDIMDSMMISFADVQCKIQIIGSKQEVKSTKPAQQKQKNDKKAEIMSMFNDDSQQSQKGQKQHQTKEQASVKDQFKKPTYKDIDFQQDFGKPQAQKQSKKGNNKEKVKSKTVEDKEKKQIVDKPEKKTKKTDKETKDQKKSQNQKGATKMEPKVEEHSLQEKKQRQAPPNKTKGKKSPSPQNRDKLKKTKDGDQKQKNLAKKSKALKEDSLISYEQKENKARRSARLSNQNQNNPTSPSKLSIPASLDIDKGRKDMKSKQELGKGSKKINDNRLSKSISPQKQQKMQIKVIKPPMKRSNRERLVSIQQVGTEIATAKKNSRKRKMSQSLDRDGGLCYVQGKLIPPSRRSKMGRRILFSNYFYTCTTNFFKVVDNYEEPYDYLIMSEYSRTFKALLTINLGLPIVSKVWLESSEQIRTVLKPQSYYFTNINHIYKAIQRAKNGNKVFEDLEFFLLSPEYHMSKDQIEALIDTGGGKLLKKLGQNKERVIGIISNKKENERSDKQLASIKGAKKDGIKIYTLELILDSCQKQQIDWSQNKVD